MTGVQTLTSRLVLVGAVASLILVALTADASAQVPNIPIPSAGDPLTQISQRLWTSVRNAGRYIGAVAVVVGMVGVMFGGHDWSYAASRTIFGGIGVFLVTSVISWLFGVAII